MLTAANLVLVLFCILLAVVSLIAVYLITRRKKSIDQQMPQILSFCKDGKLARLKEVSSFCKRLYVFEDEASSCLLDPHDGNDPLMVAAKEGNTTCVAYLLELMRDYQPNQQEPGYYSLPKQQSVGVRRPVRHNNEGWTAIHLACVAGKPDVLALFIQDDVARQLQVRS